MHPGCIYASIPLIPKNTTIGKIRRGIDENLHRIIKMNYSTECLDICCFLETAVQST